MCEGKRLEDFGIQLFSGMHVYWPQSQYIEELVLEFHRPKTFAKNNGKVCWITEKGECFLGFTTKETMEELEKQGYTQEVFFVPFSNWDGPLDANPMWRALRKKYNEEIRSHP